MSKSRFEVGQVVLYQNEDGTFIGKIKEVLTDHPEFEFLVEDDSVDVNHLFGEDYCLEDVVVLKESDLEKEKEILVNGLKEIRESLTKELEKEGNKNE